MGRRTAKRVSYLRDLEHVRRLKDAVLMDDASFDVTIQDTIVTLCELMHGVVGAANDPPTAHSIIKAKLKALQDIIDKASAST